MGTVSEVALVLKNGKSVVLLDKDRQSQQFFQHFAPESVFLADDPDSAIIAVQAILDSQSLP